MKRAPGHRWRRPRALRRHSGAQPSPPGPDARPSPPPDARPSPPPDAQPSPPPDAQPSAAGRTAIPAAGRMAIPAAGRGGPQPGQEERHAGTAGAAVSVRGEYSPSDGGVGDRQDLDPRWRPGQPEPRHQRHGARGPDRGQDHAGLPADITDIRLETSTPAGGPDGAPAGIRGRLGSPDLSRQLGERDRAGEPARGRGHQHLLGEQIQAGQIWLGLTPIMVVLVRDYDVEPAEPQLAQALVRIMLGHREVQQRVLGGQFRRYRHDESLRHRPRGGDAQVAPDGLPRQLQRGLCFLQSGQHRSRLLDERLAGERQPDPPPGPLEQGRTAFPLQCAQLLRDGRRREPECPSRCGDGAAQRHLTQNAQAADVQIHAVKLIISLKTFNWT